MPPHYKISTSLDLYDICVSQNLALFMLSDLLVTRRLIQIMFGNNTMILLRLSQIYSVKHLIIFRLLESHVCNFGFCARLEGFHELRSP